MEESVSVPVRMGDVHVDLLVPDGCLLTRAVQRSGTFYEPDLIDHIRSLDIDGCYIDGGAHVGNHTVAFALLTKADRVVAVEAHAENCTYLLANSQVARHRTPITVVNAALSETVGLLSLEDPGGRANTGRRQVAAGPTPHWVTAVTIDALAERLQLRRVGLIKLDIQGHELPALRGALAVIERDCPVVVVEAAKAKEQQAIDQVLAPYGYRHAGTFAATPTHVYRQKIDPALPRLFDPAAIDRLKTVVADVHFEAKGSPLGFEPKEVPTAADLSRRDIAVLYKLSKERLLIEVGAGGSTVLLSQAAAHLVSIETDRGWYKTVAASLKKLADRCPVDLILVKPTAPAGAIPSGDVYFIDCAKKLRAAWLRTAILQNAAPYICVHDSRRPRDAAAIATVLGEHDCNLRVQSVSFHHGGSNLTIVRLRDKPVAYEDWNRTEPTNRLPPLKAK